MTHEFTGAAPLIKPAIVPMRVGKRQAKWNMF
jgi:hypothetical protein